MTRHAIYRLIVISALIALVAATGSVLAAKAENVFAGKVVLLKRVPPAHFNTSNGFVNFIRKNRISVLHANKDNEWDFLSMAFFRKPLGDYEVQMVFYDITKGKSKSQRKFLDSFTQYTQDRNSRALLGRAVLTRPRFDANRKYLVEVQNHGRTVASGTFETSGISQKQLDEQKRIQHEMEQMKKSMEELKKKAEEQERRQKEAEKKKDAEAAEDLF